MGVHSELFLHQRDAEMNGNGRGGQVPPATPEEIDTVYLYRTDKGRVVREVGSRGRRIFCVYPGSEKVYTFWKGDIEKITDREEKIQEFKAF